jgi:2-polyprenyl-3-methyl-5-hydroxy-6-metoxy-1,4-benzoquinol methylase
MRLLYTAHWLVVAHGGDEPEMGSSDLASLTAQRVELTRTRLGYLEVNPKPTSAALEAYYRDRYFMGKGERSQYSRSYSAEEIEHTALAVAEILAHSRPEPGHAYEAGCGEGFILKGLRDLGWQVRGVDVTIDGIEMHNPELRDAVDVADVFEHIDKMLDAHQRFELVVCNHVLEHVIDPVTLAAKLVRLLTDDGICRFVVPNDGSVLQHEIVRRGMAAERFWVRYPDHLSYFTAESLTSLLTSQGWQVVDLLAAFPIDLFLLNPDSNYEKDTSLGRNCHLAAVAFELMLARSSLDSLTEFRRGCARAGVGRDLIAYASRRT